MIAKTCNCKSSSSPSSSIVNANAPTRKVAYTFVDSYHNLCIDKKDLISGQIRASEQLLKHTNDVEDRQVIEKEISELKMSIDLMS